MRHLFILLLLVTSALSHAEVPAWTTKDANGQSEVHLYLFWSLHCPHCHSARPQIIALAAERPWLRVHEFEITGNRAHLARFVELAQATGNEAHSVPALIYCGRMDSGWDEHADAVHAFLSRLEECRNSGVPEVEIEQNSSAIVAPVLGELNLANWSIPLLTIVLAGLDAFNPCAFFVLLFLLSLLVHQQSRRRMLVIGGIFVACSGLMYFAFMAAWLNLFLLIGGLPWVTTGAGGLALAIAAVNIKDYLAFHQGFSLSISEGGQANIFQQARRILRAGSFPAMLATTVVLAIAANSYELLCTAYYLAEQRGFSEGGDVEDWLAAENEIERYLSSAGLARTGDIP